MASPIEDFFPPRLFLRHTGPECSCGYRSEERASFEVDVSSSVVYFMNGEFPSSSMREERGTIDPEIRAADARSHRWTRFIIRDARVCEKLRFFTAHGGFTARDRGDYPATRVYQKPSKLARHPCVSPASASSSKFFKKIPKLTVTLPFLPI